MLALPAAGCGCRACTVDYLSRHPLGLAAVIAVVTLVVHLPSLGGSFHYDDGHSILRNPHIRDLSQIPRYFVDPGAFSENPDYAMYRPLVLVTHALNYALGDYRAAGYLAVNLGIHCLAAALVVLTLGQLIVSQPITVLGGLIFSLHPGPGECINYISARSESLAGLLYLCSYYGYLRGRCVNGGSTRVAMAWQGGSLLCFALALLTKATAVTLPLALLLHELASGWRLRRPALQWISLRRHAPYWLVLLSYLVAYQLLTSGIVQRGAGRSLHSQLATQVKALVHYLSLGPFPTRLSVYQQFFGSSSFLSPAPALALVFLISLGAGLWSLRRHLPVEAHGLGFALLTLVPTILVPLNILVNDHRIYLALFGLALAIGASLRSLPRWPAYCLCGVLAVLSAQRDRVWRSDQSLWGDAVARAPLMSEAHYNLGFAHHELEDLGKARQSYERAVALDPTYVRANNNLGAILRQDGQLSPARLAFERALAHDPESVEALNNLGLILAAQGARQQAIEVYRRALRLQPEKAEIWLNLGLAYRDEGRVEEAFQCLSRALELDPAVRDLVQPGRTSD